MIHCRYDILIAPADLRPYPEQVRVHSAEQIRRLALIIEANGFRKPIVVSTLSKCVTKGHGVLAAAQHLKLAVVPVEYQEYASAEDELADVLADNNAATGAWLAKPMRELLESPPWKDALAKCGYQEKELARNWAKAFQLTENEPDMEILRVSKHTWRQLQRLGKGLAERGLVGLLKAQEHGHLHGGGKRARRASIAKRWKVPGAGKRMVPSAISEP